jgi:hypothetical protein
MGEKVPILVFTNEDRGIAEGKAPLINADLH